MRTRQSISSDDGPTIFILNDFLAPQIDHWLYSQDHTLTQSWPVATPSVVGHFRRFVQLPSQTMSYQIPNDRKTVSLSVSLTSITYISDSLTNNTLRNREI